LKSNKLTANLFICLALVILAGCVSNYYDRFGGYPLETKDYFLKPAGESVKLQLTYRVPATKGVQDSTALNIAVKIMLDKAVLNNLSIDYLSLEADDGSYAKTFFHPAVYDLFGKYPINNATGLDAGGSKADLSDKLCLFKVTRDTPSYVINLGYHSLQPDKSILEGRSTLNIDISNVTHKTGMDNPVFLRSN
jgi:hypothetical protein